MAYLPNVLRETSEGLNQIPIQDILFQKREIFCIGPITEDTASALVLQLRFLQQDAPGQEITMYINSPGGEVPSGLAIYDVMKAVGCPMRTICTGTAASMAADWPFFSSTRIFSSPATFCSQPAASTGFALAAPQRSAVSAGRSSAVALRSMGITSFCKVN